MGWCSGTEVFDPVAQAIIDSDASEPSKIGMLMELILALEERDWDCQGEADLYHNPLVNAAMMGLHPDWIDDQDDEDEDG